MLKFLHHTHYAFDVEWVPNLDAGRRRYFGGRDADDAEVLGAATLVRHPEFAPAVEVAQ